ncbi:MAG: hypothetical protein CV087_04655 [Candidatus Brocadia sp. WS118]|nr:MAG: hypothetical protein CV087_04655 [Candidatus Brocadia sp. WS118]
MTPQVKAIMEIHEFLTREGIPYVLIGGIALQWWGEPRFTRDVDVTILVNSRDEEKVIKKMLTCFSPRITDVLEFALKNRICLVKTKDGYEIDISLGIPGYEEEVIKRAVGCKLEKGYVVKICSAEDLIIYKAVAGRHQDLGDIEGIILRQGRRLDINYIRIRLNKFSAMLETPEIKERFEAPWKQLMEEEK